MVISQHAVYTDKGSFKDIYLSRCVLTMGNLAFGTLSIGNDKFGIRSSTYAKNMYVGTYAKTISI